MKKLATILLSLFTLCTAIACADNERPIQMVQLPATAQQFIKQHFADSQVVLAKQEGGFWSKSYEVALNNGVQINFDGKGNWEEIDCKTSAVPVAVIPTQILDYVKNQYPDVNVVKIEKDRKKYEIKLSNRVELSFDSKFNLVDVDM